MLLSKVAKVKIGVRNKKHYETKGYFNLRIGDEIIVPIEHLTKGSSSLVEVLCDYCKKNKIIMQYNIYNIQQNKTVDKDCCDNCSGEKMKDVYKINGNNAQKYSIDYIEKNIKIYIEQIGYKYIGYKYKNSKLIIIYECCKHGIQENYWDNIYLKNQRCKKCFIEKVSREGSYRWKGGITSLRKYLRQKLHNWVIDMFKENYYKCVISGSKKDLVVHHLYSFDKILSETLIYLNLPVYENISKYKIDELKNIEDLILKLHYKYKGIPLTKSIHKEFHSIYGYGNNTLEQFEEFKKNYIKEDYNVN